MMTKDVFNAVHNHYYNLVSELLTTSKKNGGATVTFDNQPVNKVTGYFVSYKNVFTGQVGDCDFHSIADVLEAIQNGANKTDKSAYIGGWFDADTGLFYIDLTLWLTNMNAARLLAIEHNQKAIWDCANDCEIRI